MAVQTSLKRVHKEKCQMRVPPKYRTTIHSSLITPSLLHYPSPSPRRKVNAICHHLSHSIWQEQTEGLVRGLTASSLATFDRTEKSLEKQELVSTAHINEFTRKKSQCFDFHVWSRPSFCCFALFPKQNVDRQQALCSNFYYFLKGHEDRRHFPSKT